MISFVAGLIKLLRDILSSLKGTLGSILAAVRMRSGSKLVGLLMEGSPLESLVDSGLTLVFWVLVLSPLVLVPLVYLGMSFMR